MTYLLRFNPQNLHLILQVDRENFPCACTPFGCNNTNGRIEFDNNRVRAHLMKVLVQNGESNLEAIPSLISGLTSTSSSGENVFL